MIDTWNLKLLICTLEIKNVQLQHLIINCFSSFLLSPCALLQKCCRLLSSMNLRHLPIVLICGYCCYCCVWYSHKFFQELSGFSSQKIAFLFILRELMSSKGFCSFQSFDYLEIKMTILIINELKNSIETFIYFPITLLIWIKLSNLIFWPLGPAKTIWLSFGIYSFPKIRPSI